LNPECVGPLANIDIFTSEASSFTALIRKFDESPILYDGPNTQEGLVNFAKKYEMPIVIDVKEKMIDKLFSGERASVFLFVHSREEIKQMHDEDPEFLATFKKVATDLRGDYYFAYSGLKRGIEQRISDVLGVANVEVPTIFIAKGNSFDLVKYKWDRSFDEFNEETLKDFLDRYEKGLLPKYLKT